MSDKIEVNRRRVLGGLVTIGAAGAAVGAGTFAAFSDTEASSGNTVQAGTLAIDSAADGQLGIQDLVPNESFGPSTIQATYSGDSSIDAAGDIDISISESDITPDPHNTNVGISAFAQELSLTTAELTKNTSSVYDLTTNESVSTVNDLNGLSISDEFGSISPSDTIGLQLAGTMNDVGNDYQADGISLKVTFTANQP